MKKPESVLRNDISAAMRAYWVMDWHEDREINPGVPDLSFIMYGDCEMGWIELKAIHPSMSSYRFKFEPSQFNWFRSHCDLIPLFVYLRVNGVADFLVRVDKNTPDKLSGPVTDEQLREMSVAVIDPNKIVPTLPRVLRNATKRTRNEESVRQK